MNRWTKPTTLTEAKRAAWDDDDWLGGVMHCARMIESTILFHAFTTILDFGAGPARMAGHFAAVHPSCRIVAYEPNEEMWDHNYIRNWPTLGPRRKPEFHAAYSTLVFQHLDRPDMICALADISRVLLPGGIFRLQYANESADQGPLSHPRTSAEMVSWCEALRLSVRDVEYDPKFPTWSWLTATKQGDSQ